MKIIANYQIYTTAVRQIASQIAEKGRLLSPSQVREKSAGDIATEIDLWAEQELRQRLHTLVPGSHFMGEETGGALGDAPTWVVDPIDGTANFARGYPQWGVSVALAIAGEPVVGIVCDPLRGETFHAAQGQGAWLSTAAGEQRLHCAPARPALSATVSTVFPKPHAPFIDLYLREFSQVIRSFGQVRRSGSMALELAYVAAGRADAFWEHGMAAWDAAAGKVLLQEAGAVMEAMDGRPLLSSQFLAAGSVTGLADLKACLFKS
jgi:myo-inositol-1(or 4)-monophosphatase